MVSFNFGAALLAGFAGTVVMTLLMQMSAAMGMTRMPSMQLIQGLMVTGNEAKAKKVGLFTHGIMMGTIVFGLVYAGLFVALDDVGVVTGLSIGVAHGIVAGVVMVMFGVMHPRMDPPVAGRTEAVTTIDGETRLLAPGLFAKNYGPMTPVGLLIGHAVYGLVAVLVYGAIT